MGIIDSQSVKNMLVATQSCSFDGGQEDKRRKAPPHYRYDGAATSSSHSLSGIQDRTAAITVVEKLVENWKKIVKVFADGSCTGKWIAKAKKQFGILIEVVKCTEAHVFKVLPRRWIVERTFAWIETNRRNAKFYERLEDTG